MRTPIPAVSLLLCACGPACPELCADLSGTPEVVLATGEEEATPLTDGATLDFVQGPQGGYHAFGSAIIAGLVPEGPDRTFSDPCNPQVDFDLTGEGVSDSYFEVPRAFLPRADGRFDLVGQRVTLDQDDPDALDGRSATFTVRVTDACGRTATASQRVTLRYAGSGVDTAIDGSTP